MQPENQQQLGASTKPNIQTGIELSYDIKAPPMVMYLLTKELLKSLRKESASDELTMFGVSIGVVLTIAGVLIPLYIGNIAPHTQLIPFLWAVLVAFGAMAYYFGRKWQRIRGKDDKEFDEVLENSATVVTIKQTAQATKEPPTV
jgi:uncharacterized membrane protein (DUF441 family)